MKASGWEFRHRLWIILAIYGLGFTTPWDAVLHLDGQGANAHGWGWAAGVLTSGGVMSFQTAFAAVLVAAIVCAVLGAWLRIWGSAYLGADVMGDAAMRGEAMMADGPYRYMRNPLYLGSWLNTLALMLLMRPSGAVFTLVVLVLFHVRLILAEEVFLREKLGEGYVAYCAAVPRLMPRFKVRGSGFEGNNRHARWGQAALAEVYMWGSALSFAVLGWRYDTGLLLQAMLVCLGVSLVVKGLGLGQRGEAA